MTKHELIEINDFKIILNHREDSKTTMVESYISSGFINESKENAGISHLLEHVVTEGWKKCGRKGCQAYWKKRGVLTNASTGQTTVQYYMHGLEQYSMDMLDYIVSISINPEITKSRIDKEKKAVQNELMIHAAHPQMGLFNLLNKMLFRIEGLIVQDDMPLQLKNLDAIGTVDKLKSWCNRFYGSGNMIFVISGNFSKSEVKRFLLKKLKKARPVKVIPTYTDIFKPGLDVQFLKNDQIDNTNISFAFHAPIYQQDMDVYYIEFFKEFIGSGITSMLMEVLREQNEWIYNVGIDNYTSPYGTFIIIEIATKNEHIKNVVVETLNILKKLASGKFKKGYLEYVKKAYMVEHYETCLNNSYLSSFYGEQYINQLYNVESKPKILSFRQVADSILKLKQFEFVAFIKKLLIFSNMKLAYQGKKEIKQLPQITLKTIGRREKRLPH
jgi:predicted Zn-dependent peptidase